MFETFKPMLDRLLPDVLIASAAIGVFVVLAVVILISILFENWYEARKHHSKAIANSQASPMPQ